MGRPFWIAKSGGREKIFRLKKYCWSACVVCRQVSKEALKQTIGEAIIGAVPATRAATILAKAGGLAATGGAGVVSTALCVSKCADDSDGGECE